MNRFYLTEEQVKYIEEKISSWRGYDNFNEYQKEDDTEMMEYLRVWPDDSGISVDLWVDDGGSYIRHNHPLWLYFRNGKTIKDGFIPISINDNPQIMIRKPKLNIDKTTLIKIITFIRKNKKNIIKLAKGEIINTEFLDIIKPIISNNINESIIINEMATMQPKLTGLRVPIWVDEGTSPQHTLRIKFQASSEQRNTREYSTMTVEDKPRIFNFPKNADLVDKKDLEAIRNFVIYNKDLLIALSQGIIKYRVEFLKYMTKIGKNGGPLYSPHIADIPEYPINNTY